MYSVQFTVLTTLPTHTHIPQRVDESSAYYQEQVRQAKQIMTPFTLRRLKSQVLSELPAKVSSTEHCQLTETQWTLYRGVVERSLRVNQGRHGECLQGNVVCWEIVTTCTCSLCCGCEAVWVVLCAEIVLFANVLETAIYPPHVIF